MMGPGDGYPHGHGNPHHSGVHHSFPMDLHVHQGFPYYRQPFDPSARFPPGVQAMPPVLELRKEKSRDAARSRRGKENYEFYELAKMLPLPAAITSQLDKASIIRLTISYLRIKDFSAHGDPPWLRDNPLLNKKGQIRNGPSNPTLDLFEQHQGTHILQSLDGFAFALAADGRFLYISETVSIYLGLSQVEMTGSSVFDYIHQNDHAELAEQLGLGLSHGPGANVPSPVGSDDGSSDPATNNPDVSSIMSVTSNAGYKGLDRAFCIRMKSTLTKRGCHFKSSGYRVVLVLSRLRAQYSFSHKRSVPPPLLGMVALAIALPPPSVHEIRLESHMFVTKVTFDFKIIHSEPRTSELLDYKTEELTGRSLYSLCHAEDVKKLRKCHVDLLDKGQVMSEYYRVLNKNGGYVWIQTCATVVSSSKNSEDQIIICVNYVISYSGSEFTNVVMDCCQLEQECSSIVKRETLTDDLDKMSSNDSVMDGNSIEISTGTGLWDSNRSPSTTNSRINITPHREGESPVIRDTDVNSVEKNATVTQRGSAKVRLNGDGLTHSHSKSNPNSRPFTPISPSITTNHDMKTPQSVKSLDSETSATTTTPIPQKILTPQHRGRKRKSEKLNLNHQNNDNSDNLITSNFDSTAAISFVNHQAHSENNNVILASTNHLVGRPIASKGSASSCLEISRLKSTNFANASEAENSGSSARWRKTGQTDGSTSSSSSVNDLDNLMSKHLPNRENGQIISATDFSTESLLRQQTGLRTESAIQWFGTTSQSTPGLPVSALLHRICASRESVIRANVQAAAAAAAVQAASRSYYPDVGSTVASALPTPPDSEIHGSEDSQLKLNSHHHHKSNVTYSANSSFDYRPVLTPPASVSPRDKLSYSSSASAAVTINSYEEPSAIVTGTSFRPPRSSYLGSSGQSQHLPLKPQIYDYHPHSSIESQYGNAMTDYSQSQFYPPPHISFPLYHQEKPAIYEDAIKNANWYSATS